MKKVKKQILKSVLAIGIIAFAASVMTECSCKKPASGNNNTSDNAGNGNNGNNNGGGGGNGGGGSSSGSGSGDGGSTTDCTGICPTTNLVLEIPTANPSYVKISGNVATINAADLATATTPHSDADDSDRGFEDARLAATSSSANLFKIEYPGATAALIFVGRKDVTKDNIALRAATNSAHHCSSSESDDESFASAAGGGHCRVHLNNGVSIGNHSYLGTVFNNASTAMRARGIMRCYSELNKWDAAISDHAIVTDSLIFSNFNYSTCSLISINSAGTASTAEIDDAWVDDTASVKEAELYAIGINVSGKTIPKWSDGAVYGLTEFKEAHDNAAFKKLLQTNPWAELKFKVKIVKSSAF